ncbi:MAG: hypothetical protein KJ710_06695 [Candidatus Omnitrophica bacterium]|nr:hypothetical protein [Candidatus Omnitrophota bacterium]MBU1923922.1 hypothetical protein [Candidatus Omnitrophota bacterium]
MNPAILQKEKSILLKKIRILSLVLLLAFAVIIAFTVFFLKEQGLLTRRAELPYIKNPYAAEVKKIVDPLRYSGIQMFVNNDVYLTLDFDKKIWILHNVHSFNDKGELILQEDRYGTCGELAAYTASKVRPLFENNYNIQFVRASQSGYFLSLRASHIVLRITAENNKSEIFILDPSFHKYGPIYEFEDYLFIEQADRLDFVDNKIKDITQSFNRLIPLIIRNDYLVGVTVEDRNSEFGQKNFVLGLTLTKKHNYAGRFILALRSFNGKAEIVENKKLALEVLKEQEWSILKQKITELFEQAIDKPAN